MTNNSINNQTTLHAADLMIIKPGLNITLMIECVISNSSNLLRALVSMDVVFPDRNISTTNYKKIDTKMKNNAYRTDIVNNTLLDGEK